MPRRLAVAWPCWTLACLPRANPWCSAQFQSSVRQKQEPHPEPLTSTSPSPHQQPNNQQPNTKHQTTRAPPPIPGRINPPQHQVVVCFHVSRCSKLHLTHCHRRSLIAHAARVTASSPYPTVWGLSRPAHIIATKHADAVVLLPTSTRSKGRPSVQHSPVLADNTRSTFSTASTRSARKVGSLPRNLTFGRRGRLGRHTLCNTRCGSH